MSPLSIRNQYKVFGHTQLGYIFFPLIKILKNGFYFKKIFYPWYEINQINIWQKTYGYNYDDPITNQNKDTFEPCAEIILKSGRILFIDGMNLKKKYNRLDKGFLTTFDELIYEIKKTNPLNFQLIFYRYIVTTQFFS